jgi:peptide/nickel transport system substrate-binding protein
VATIVQASWKQLGLEVSIKVAPPAEYQDLAFGHKAQTIMRLDGPAHGLGAGYFLGYDMLCNSINSLSQMCIAGADDLLTKARATSDPKERQALFDQINELWKAYTPRMPIFEDKQAIVLNKHMTSFFYSPMPDYRLWAKSQ